MEQLESQLKKGNDQQKTLETLLRKIQGLEKQNQALHEKLDRLEDKLEDKEIYDSTEDTYLSNKPGPQVEEFKRRLRKNAEGVNVSIISTIFQIKPRQAYNVKDRIVDEEEWVAEIPKSNSKNRVVSKKRYLVDVIKSDYPDLPASIYDETGKSIGNLDWQTLFTAYADNVARSSVDERVDKLQRLAEWFEAEDLMPEL